MTTKNWPDPKRPGVPMFPERDGWHALIVGAPCAAPTSLRWNAAGKVWKLGSSKHTPEAIALETFKYIGPILTPAHINEMLAAERDRAECAADTRRLDWLEKLPFADVGRLTNGWEICINHVRHWDVQPTLREAIDAAMETK